MFKILQARLQEYMNQELSDVQAGFRKGRGNQRSNCQHRLDHRKKQENSRKTSMSTSLTMLKPLTVWITTNCGQFFKRWEYQTTWPASWEISMQVKKQVRTCMEQQTGSKLVKECVKTVYCHSAYLTYMQSTSCEMLGWMKHNLESRLPGEILIASDTQMTPLDGRK